MSVHLVAEEEKQTNEIKANTKAPLLLSQCPSTAPATCHRPTYLCAGHTQVADLEDRSPHHAQPFSLLLAMTKCIKHFRTGSGGAPNIT